MLVKMELVMSAPFKTEIIYFFFNRVLIDPEVKAGGENDNLEIGNV
jgi:hypothetical protein